MAIALAVVAGVTDYLDGAIARATGQVTRLGEILDQFCDLCYESLRPHGGHPRRLLPALCHPDLPVSGSSGCSAFVATLAGHAGKNIPSSLLGKLKTNFVMWGFLPTFLCAQRRVAGGRALLTEAGRMHGGRGLVLSYLSGIGYTRAFAGRLRERRSDSPQRR